MVQPRFCQLPDELLLNILTHLTGSLNTRLLSPDTTHHDLVAVMNVCKRVHPIAQGHLLHTPTLHDTVNTSHIWQILKLIHILLQAPELRNHIKQLRIELPDNGRLTTAVAGIRAFDHTTKAYVDKLPCTPAFKNELAYILQSGYYWPLLGVLVALLPNLSRLSILPQDKGGDYTHLPPGMNVLEGILFQRDMHRGGIFGNAGLRNLTYLKMKLVWGRLSNLNILRDVTTLDLELPHIQLDSYDDWMDMRLRGAHFSVHHVRHLRLDFRTHRVPSQGTREWRLECLRVVRGFKNLRILDLYGETTVEMCRTGTPDSERDYRSDVLGYMKLDKLLTCLETLRLPHLALKEMEMDDALSPAFSSTSAPDLRPFAKLARLLIPQSWLIQQRELEFKINYALMLPLALEHITVFAADARIFKWIEEMMVLEDQYSALKSVLVLLAPHPIYRDTDFKMLMEKTIRKSFWRGVGRARVKWRVGRDTLDHAVDVLE